MPGRFLEHWQDYEPMDSLMSDAPVMMHATDSQGVLLMVSAFWADTLGYPAQDMIGPQSMDFLTKASRTYAQTIMWPKFLESGGISNVELEFLRCDGSIIPVILSAIAQSDGTDQTRRCFAILFDDTEAKRTQTLLNPKLRDDAVGKLAAVVAHDFNNLLSVILGNLEFLSDVPDFPEATEMIKDALAATQRGAVLTDQLVSYGRRAQLRPKAQHLGELV